MKKTTKKATKTTAKSKPILSTAKKIGLTIYFTFIFTLMGVMGLLIWLNGPNGVLSNESINTPPPSYTQQETTTNTQDFNDTTVQNYYDNQKYNNTQNPTHNVGTSYAF